MIDQAGVADVAAREGLGDIAADLAALALPGFRLVPSVGRSATGATRLGGLPDLPQDLDWPTPLRRPDEPMTFFAQVATHDLDPLGVLDPAVWPALTECTLSFFAHQGRAHRAVDGEGSARVLVTPPGVALEPRDPPDELPREMLLSATEVTTDPTLSVPTLGVEPAVALKPFGLDYNQPRQHLNDDYLRFADRVAGGAADRISGPTHQLFGWPRLIQGDVLEEFESMDVPANRAAPRSNESGRWRLLLQVDDDPRLGGAGFGDGGAIYFGLPAEDLTTERFDRVEAGSQSG